MCRSAAIGSETDLCEAITEPTREQSRPRRNILRKCHELFKISWIRLKTRPVANLNTFASQISECIAIKGPAIDKTDLLRQT